MNIYYREKSELNVLDISSQKKEKKSMDFKIIIP